MGETTTVRIDRATHEELKRLARRRNASVTETVAQAVRALRQDTMGAELSGEVSEDEIEWLGADRG
jgi:predicted transcriptional regulator